MITNKSLPFEIVYTTSEDENDAAVNIWEAFQERVLRQKNNYEIKWTNFSPSWYSR
jgi:hypothetical protein